MPKIAPYSPPTEAKYADDFVELVAWFTTEGHMRSRTRQLCICQSTNKQHNINRMKRIVPALGGSFKSEKMHHIEGYSPIWYGFFNGKVADDIKAIVDDEKVVCREFINSLTKEQLQIYTDTLLDADGYRFIKSRGKAIATINRNMVESYQHAFILAGYSTSIRWAKANNQWVLGVNCRNNIYISHLDKEQVSYKGIVWCPHTKNNSFLARRNDKVYITGNTAIQGGAGDLMKLEISRLYQLFQENPHWDAHLLMIVHDEFVIEAKLEYIHEAKAAVKESMETVWPSCTVPIKADIDAFWNWGGMKGGSSQIPEFENSFLSQLTEGFWGDLLEA